jgi:hypothetical protein
LTLILPAQAQAEAHLRSVVGTDVERAKATERALASERSLNQTLSERVQQLEARVTATVTTALVAEAKARTLPGHVQALHPSTPPHKHCRDTGDPLDDCLGGGRAR